MKNQFKVFSPQRSKKLYPTDLELILQKVKNKTKILILTSIVLRTNRQSNSNSKSIFILIYPIRDDFKKKKSDLPRISLCAMEERRQILVFPSNPESLECPLSLLMYAHMQIICFQHTSLVSVVTISTALIYYLLLYFVIKTYVA